MSQASFRHLIVCLKVCAACLLTLAACTSCKPALTKAESIQRGDELFEQKEYARAAEAYRGAVVADPRDGALRMKLANAYARAGSGQAAKEAAIAADLLPGNIDAQLLVASLLLAQESFFDAVERASAVLRQQPDNVGALVTWGNATARLSSPVLALSKLDEAMRAGDDYERVLHNLRPLVSPSDDDAAEAALRKAVQLAPTNLSAQIALANFLWATGRAGEGEQPLKIWADGQSDGFPSRVLGGFYLSQRRDADGEKYLKSAVAREDRDAKLTLADHYARVDRENDALEILRGMTTKGDTSAEVTLRVAAIEFRSGKRDPAIQRVDGVLAREPYNARGLLLKAQFLSAGKQWEQAQRAARAALAANPRSSERRVTLGRILSATGDLEGAFAELSEALRLDPNAGDLLLPLAQLSLSLGRNEEAVQFARDAKRRQPDDPEASLALVKALVLTRDYSRADLELKPLLAHAPSSPDVLVQLGTVQAALNDHQAALATFTRALEANRESLDALSGLVSLELKADGVAAARQRVDQALASHADDPGYLILAAKVYTVQNDTARAERTFRQVLTIDPKNVGAALSLAEGLSRQGRTGSARGVLEQLLEHRPQSLEAQTELASLFNQMGDAAEAQVRYEKIMAQYPHAAVAAYRLATLYADRREHLDVALGLAAMAVQMLPNEPDAADALGWVYTGKNMATRGLPYLQEAVRAAPNNAVYRYHLGSAYLRAGERGKAEDEFARALQIDRNFRYADQIKAALASGRK